MKKIIIASDHAGLFLKNFIKQHLNQHNYQIVDCGTYESQSCHYPIYSQKAVNTLLLNPQALCILFCGSGIGVSIVANKFNQVGCVHCIQEYTARQAKILGLRVISLGSRTVGVQLAKSIVDAFLQQNVVDMNWLRKDVDFLLN